MWAREIRFLTTLRAFAPNKSRLNHLITTTTPRRHTCAAVPPSSDASLQSDQPLHNAPTGPRIPLCDRAPTHAAQLAALLAWQRHALDRLSSIGDAWVVQDEGPCQKDLETELSWLLDDAVAAVVDETGAPPQAVTWRRLERELHSGTLMLSGTCTIQLRESLEGLGKWFATRLSLPYTLQLVNFGC
jgi:hypothetical protein